MTFNGTPSLSSSSACACRSWCGAKRRRTPARAARRCHAARAAEACHARPQLRPLITQNSGPTGIVSRAQPWLELRKAPVHADLAAPAAFAAAHQHRAASRVELEFTEIERFLDPEPGPPEH